MIPTVYKMKRLAISYTILFKLIGFSDFLDMYWFSRQIILKDEY